MKNYNGYELGKERAIECAVNFQQNASRANYSLSEFVVTQRKVIKLGKRYGLLKEFKENGIL